MREIIDGLRMEPRTCTWELTLRCNMSCGHCGSRAGKPRPSEMSTDTALRVTRELASLGCRKLSLSGGEPTLSPFWEHITREGSKLGMRINMITNGLTAGRELVRRAKDAGLVSLGVSLDGLEDAHDRNRSRKGHFRNIQQLMDDCAAEGLPVGVITTIWNENYRDLEALHDLIAGRAYVWQLQLGAAMGNLEDNRTRQIRPDDLLHIVPAVARLIRKGKMRIHVADNLGYYGPYEETLRTRRSTPVSCWIGCYAGCRHVGIESDGGVKGCLSIQSTRATEGNLQQSSLSDIWWREGAFAYNRQFQLDDLAGFCRTCEHASICRGGCLSMRTCEGGRENPFCYHRVATLAEQRAAHRRPRYTPMAIAPAALLALFGLGCGGSTDEQPPAQEQDAQAEDAEVLVDAYGLPAVDAQPDTASYYGVPDPEAGMGDAYGLPADAQPDTASYYGMPDPEAGMGDAYGLPADAQPDTGSWYGMPDPEGGMADAYGLPADADVDAGSYYGMPDPDGGQD